MKVTLRTGLFDGSGLLRGSSAPTRPRHDAMHARGAWPNHGVRRVLVTGADGFVGAQIAATLRAHGVDVVGVVFRRGAGCHEVRADLTVASNLRTLPPDVDAIVHAAGVVRGDVPARRVFDVNLGSTRALLAWSKQHALRHFVQVSSVAVYGPLVLGTHRTERTPRLGKHIGLPYMRSKALAEVSVEQSTVPYTLIRPPAIIGSGDTVLTQSLVRALRGDGIPVVSPAGTERLVSLCFSEGLANLTLAALRRGPLNDAVHAVDVELRLGELIEHYASALGVPSRISMVGASAALSRRSDAGYSWLVASSLAGQHYSAEQSNELFGEPPRLSTRDVVRAAVRGL